MSERNVESDTEGILLLLDEFSDGIVDGGYMVDVDGMPQTQGGREQADCPKRGVTGRHGGQCQKAREMEPGDGGDIADAFSNIDADHISLPGSTRQAASCPAATGSSVSGKG